MVLQVIGIIIGVFLGLILALYVGIKKLQGERYTDTDRFWALYKVFSVAIPLVFRIKVEAVGVEKLEGLEKAVLFPNHQHLTDPLILFPLIKRPHGYVAKKELDHIFLLSDAMRLLRCQFLDRDDVRQSVKAISAATKAAREGHWMVIFPEGTRMIRGELGTFKAGSFKIAQKSKSAIVPVTIFNSDEVSKRWPRKTMVKVMFHDPIPFEQYESMTTQEISQDVEKIVKGVL